MQREFLRGRETIHPVEGAATSSDEEDGSDLSSLLSSGGEEEEEDLAVVDEVESAGRPWRRERFREFGAVRERGSRPSPTTLSVPPSPSAPAPSRALRVRHSSSLLQYDETSDSEDGEYVQRSTERSRRLEKRRQRLAELREQERVEEEILRFDVMKDGDGEEEEEGGRYGRGPGQRDLDDAEELSREWLKREKVTSLDSGDIAYIPQVSQIERKKRKRDKRPNETKENEVEKRRCADDCVSLAVSVAQFQLLYVLFGCWFDGARLVV